jgi:hypothetical protein
MGRSVNIDRKSLFPSHTHTHTHTHTCRIGSDDLLGCCVLGPDSPTFEGREQWREAFAGMNASNDLIVTDPRGENDDGIVRTHVVVRCVCVCVCVCVWVINFVQMCACTLLRLSKYIANIGKKYKQSVYRKPKPRAVGKWHSLLAEIPEDFRDYAKK